MLKRTNEEGGQRLWGFPRPEITWWESQGSHVGLFPLSFT